MVYTPLLQFISPRRTDAGAGFLLLLFILFWTTKFRSNDYLSRLIAILSPTKNYTWQDERIHERLCACGTVEITQAANR